MTPLFCEDLIISASSPVRALDKLAANGITAYSARRIAPGKLKIRVKCKETAKIFAIFRGSCYTVTKAGPARLAKLRARYPEGFSVQQSMRRDAIPKLDK